MAQMARLAYAEFGRLASRSTLWLPLQIEKRSANESRRCHCQVPPFTCAQLGGLPCWAKSRISLIGDWLWSMKRCNLSWSRDFISWQCMRSGEQDLARVRLG